MRSRIILSLEQLVRDELALQRVQIDAGPITWRKHDQPSGRD